MSADLRRSILVTFLGSILCWGPLFVTYCVLCFVFFGQASFASAVGDFLVVMPLAFLVGWAIGTLLYHRPGTELKHWMQAFFLTSPLGVALALGVSEIFEFDKTFQYFPVQAENLLGDSNFFYTMVLVLAFVHLWL